MIYIPVNLVDSQVKLLFLVCCPLLVFARHQFHSKTKKNKKKLDNIFDWV